MEKIPLGLAKKFRQLLDGEAIPYSQMKNKEVSKMLEDGILQTKILGRSRQQIYIGKPERFTNYLSSHLGINDLKAYIRNLEIGSSRAENILASTDSKISKRRTFKGFLVNCTGPINAEINGENLLLHPQEGTFLFIHDFESFNIPQNIQVIGVENSENFRYIQDQAHLFNTTSALFVSRYPQSRDLISWLKQIPNPYLHFGDFDFEGIRIFRDEFHKQLGERANFFIPPDLEQVLEKYGNKNLYNKQLKSTWNLAINRETEELIVLFHKHKKCLEQEILIKKK